MASSSSLPPARVASGRPRRPRRIVGAALVVALLVLPLVGLGVTSWFRRLDGMFARRTVFAELTRSSFRPIEPWLSYPPVVAHRTMGAAGRVPGSGDVPLLSMQALGRLERAGDAHGVAVANLMAGELGQAGARLDRLLEETSTRTNEVLNDRAAVALAEGDVATALTLLDEVLDRNRNHHQALFNRALALRALRLPLGAIELFQQVARLGEPGWSQEAAHEAERLRGDVSRRTDAWKAALAVQQQVASTGKLPAAASIAGQAEFLREGLYDVIWSALEPASVLAVAPLAKQLDVHFGDGSLGRLVAAVARADFSRRRSLATQYAAFLAGKLGGQRLVAAALEKKTDPAVRDLVIGALASTGLVKDHLDLFAQLAVGYDDPWFETVEQEGRWAHAYALRHYTEAARIAGAGLTGCERVPLVRRCVMYELRLGQALSSLYRLSEAQSHLRHARERALGEGLLLEESMLLAATARLEINRFRGAVGAALFEEIARNPESRCIDVLDAHEKLAEHHLQRGRADDAAAELARVRPCPRQPALSSLGIRIATALRRFGVGLVDRAKVAAGLRLLDSYPGPETRAISLLAHGRWTLLDDPARGVRLLNEALAAAPMANEVDRPMVESEGNLALAFESALHSQWRDSLESLRRAAAVAMPEGCILGVVVDLDRELYLLRTDPNGGAREAGNVVGSYQRRARPRDVDFEQPSPWQPVIPAALRASLNTCPSVKVIAPGKQRRWTRLFDRQVIWSYAALPAGASAAGRPSPSPLARGGQSGTGPSVRLIVSDPRPPTSLLLGRLAPIDLGPGAGPSVISLQGLAASPQNLRARLPEADLVELHVHGMVDVDVSQNTALVLSPDATGNFLFTRADLEGVSLPRHPIVVLAACEAANLATRRPDAAELADAFMRAGGSAVVASTGKIPDGQAERFFSHLRDGLARGRSVSEALRDARVAWTNAGTVPFIGSDLPDHPWTDDVIAYE